MNYTCFSGGASGSDYIFSTETLKHNFKVIDYSFDGHNTKSSNVVILSPNQLKEGFKHIEIANKRLNRNNTKSRTELEKNLEIFISVSKFNI